MLYNAVITLFYSGDAGECIRTFLCSRFSCSQFIYFWVHLYPIIKLWLKYYTLHGLNVLLKIQFGFYFFALRKIISVKRLFWYSWLANILSSPLGIYSNYTLITLFFLNGFLRSRFLKNNFFLQCTFIHILNTVKPPLIFITIWLRLMEWINLFSLALVSVSSKC